MAFRPDIHYFQTLPSTMDVARERALLNAVEGTVIQTGEQTAGRGRFGNQWLSPPGNLYMTTVLRPQKSVQEVAQLSFVIAVALFDALVTCGVDAQNITLKWPNDVLISNKKIAGILLERDPNFILVGTGVNIAHAPDGAVTLKELCSSDDVQAFRDVFLNAIAARYADWLDHGFEMIRAVWLDHAHGMGQAVTARMADKSVSGVFDGVDTSGNLVMLGDGGQKRLITGAEIHFEDTKS